MQEINWVHRIRNIATLLVIAIHVAAPVVQEDTTYNTSFWWSGNIWDSLGRPAVPLFVMLSGFLILSKDYPISVFLKKRFMRVVIPSIFWMIVYSYYNYRAHQHPTDLKTAFYGIMEGPVHYHLWYIYLIVGLYLMYPILRPFVKYAKEADYMYLFIVCALGTWGHKILVTFFDIRFNLYWETFTNHVGYFVLGYYLANKLPSDSTETPQVKIIQPWRYDEQTLKIVGWFLILSGTMLTAVLTWYFSLKQNSFFPFFYDYLTPTVSMQAIGWFLVLRFSLKKSPLLPVEQVLSACSFGIYLLHPLVRDWLSESGYWQTKFHPSKCIPIMMVMVSVFTFIYVLILRAVPGGKQIT